MISIDIEKLRGVLFDLGGTLIYIDFDPDFLAKHLYDRFSKLVDPDDPILPEDEHSAFALRHWKKMKQEYFDRGNDFTMDEFTRSLLREMDYPQKSIDRLTPLCNEIIFNFEYDNTALYDGAIELLEYLKRNRYKIGLISNTSYSEKFIRKLMRKVKIEDYFEIVLSSSDERCSKPNPQIFLKALNYLHLKPEEALYIGDRPEFDAEGAESVGMQWVIIDENTDLNSILDTFAAI